MTSSFRVFAQAGFPTLDHCEWISTLFKVFLKPAMRHAPISPVLKGLLFLSYPPFVRDGTRFKLFRSHETPLFVRATGAARPR